MSNAPPEVIDRLKNFVFQQNGQYPTIPANPNYTTPQRFIQPPPSMSLPFRQGGAPPLAGVAAMGNPGIAEAFARTAPGASPVPQPGVDPNRPPDPPIPGLDRLLTGGSYGGLL